MARIAAIVGAVMLCGVTVDGACADCVKGSRRDAKNARRSAASGASVGAAAPRTAQQGTAVRLPYIKLLTVVDAKTVYMRTDNVLLQRLGDDGGIIQDRFFINGDTAETDVAPDARAADEITLRVGESCLVDGKTEFHKYEILALQEGKARIRHSGRTRGNLRIEQTVDVASYADAAWRNDPEDPARITYTEWDDSHHLRVEKQYRGNRLNGRWTQWHANGQKQLETHWINGERHGLWTEWYPTGEKRYEATYRDGRMVGTEYWWRRDNTVLGTGEHEADDGIK